MRIIAGERRGLILKTVDFEGFRPTLARVKESLFGILTPALEGARVLDLFAGSGALGLEAISRGAAKALFVDNNKLAIKALEANINRCGFQDRCRVVDGDFTLVGKRVARGEQFDLVFADPPYLQRFPQRVLNHVVESNLLAPEGLLSLEMDKKEVAEFLSPVLTLIRDEKYGGTVIQIFRRNR